MQRFRSVLILFLVLTLMVSGCSAMKPAAREAVASYDQAAGSAAMPVAPQAESPSGKTEEMALGTTAISGVEGRMIVTTVDLGILVEDTDTVFEQIRSVLQANGGFVSSANRYLVGGQAHAMISVRIPADKLDAFLGVVRDASISVMNEQTSG
ncbi:MAG: DUF4349 domain-containing protein, partial [Chloroflexi bacterium]|nr:DUF4349 domain-containing protein [Chloroflexota bacterium]